MAQQMGRRGFLKRLGLMGGAATVTAAGADEILGAVGRTTAQSNPLNPTYLGLDSPVGAQGIIGGYLSHADSIGQISYEPNPYLANGEATMPVELSSNGISTDLDKELYLMHVKFNEYDADHRTIFYKVTKGNKTFEVDRVEKLRRELVDIQKYGDVLLEITAEKTEDAVNKRSNVDSYIALGEVRATGWKARDDSFAIAGFLGTVIAAVGIGAGLVYKRKVSGRKVVQTQPIRQAVPVAQPLPAYLQETQKPVSIKVEEKKPRIKKQEDFSQVEKTEEKAKERA